MFPECFPSPLLNTYRIDYLDFDWVNYMWDLGSLLSFLAYKNVKNKFGLGIVYKSHF